MKLFTKKISLTRTQCLAIEILRMRLCEATPTTFVQMDVKNHHGDVEICGICTRQEGLIRFSARVAFEGSCPTSLMLILKSETGGLAETGRLDNAFVQRLLDQFEIK